MICTSVIPSLSTGLAKNDKVMLCLSYFPGLFGHFESLAFIQKLGGGQTLHQNSQT